jgi:hypothetical protein
MTIDDFTSLSKFLLGVPLPEFGIPDLPSDLVSFYWNILNGKDAGFARLIAAWIPIAKLPSDQQTAAFESTIKGNADLWSTAQKVIMLWYTAVWDRSITDRPILDPALQYPDPDQSYPYALVWVLSQSHPQGIPQGFGYWQYSPSES